MGGFGLGRFFDKEQTVENLIKFGKEETKGEEGDRKNFHLYMVRILEFILMDYSQGSRQRQALHGYARGIRSDIGITWERLRRSHKAILLDYKNGKKEKNDFAKNYLMLAHVFIVKFR